MEPIREIEALVEFEGRGPGTDAERRAGQHLLERVRGLGRDGATEAISVFPNFPVAHAIHAFLGAAGSVLSVFIPVLGAAVVLVAAVSATLDLNGGRQLVRRLTGRRASQNVVSPEGGEKAGRIVITAHYDAGRAGAPYSRRALERRAAYSQRTGRPLGIFQPYYYSLLVVLLCALLRLLLRDSIFVSIVQFVPTVILIAAIPLFLDIALSGFTPGATDNASGVSTALRLADRYGGSLDHFDVWLVLTGSGEGLFAGMREFLRRHGDELKPERTVVLNLDTVGNGTVRWAKSEGAIVGNDAPPALLEICEQIAEEDEERGEERRFGARGYETRTSSDAFLARSKQIPALTITCLNALDYAPNNHQQTDTVERLDDEALERAYGFCCELIERIDARIGPELDEAEQEEDSPLVEEESS